MYHVPGDAFLLCSDGLCDLVEDHEILEIVGSMPAAQAAGKLVDLANARGGHDNITVLILRAREAAIAPPAGLPPTVVQGATQAPDTVVDTSPPVMDAQAAAPRATRTTEPLIAVPHAPPAPVVIPPAPEPAPPSSSRSSELPAARSPNPAIIVGVILALSAMLLLGGVLLSHLSERKGKPSEKGSLGLPSFADAQTPAAPTTLTPGSIVVPSATAADPIAPLQPSPGQSSQPPR